ncbi:MAG TPA: glycine--tRNA ligase subunit beta [Caulobacteraceae bacterium]|jgi:glycyl-tRNA synthetase beta chain|nr:glycine--tRNA ligase subunit beta [Caulobacteraceae bacterium]
MPQLLLELFSEEIPARMQAQAARDLERMAKDALTGAGLAFESLRTFAGPRRLTLAVEGLPLAQEDRVEERKGPRANAPDQALQGFLRSTGLTRDQLVERDGVLFASIARPGQPTPVIVAEMVEAIVRAFPWPKSMRWGSGSLRWVRPLQRILCVFDGKTVPFEIEGIASGDLSEGHRFMGEDRAPFAAHSFDAYAQGLAGHFVVLDVAERRRRILDGARAACAAKGLELVEDEGLLDEVSGLAEWPAPILGDMDPDFLDLPPEVIRTSMRTHQKYFAVRDPKVAGRLAPHFLVVANIEASDGGALVAAGNARVLSARLNDARFFWDEDRKVSLESRLERLKGVTFHAKLGTMAERVERITVLAQEIAPLVGADPKLAAIAARLAKADLATGMVGEFPELQGIMGGYYARMEPFRHVSTAELREAEPDGSEDPLSSTDQLQLTQTGRAGGTWYEGLDRGQVDAVADAVRDHYRPAGPNDAVPTAPASVAVALADKLDTLVGFFAVDEKPTGSKDPYALRRAALGVIRIVVEAGYRVPLKSVLVAHDERTSPAGGPRVRVIHGGACKEVQDLLAFFADRLKVLLRDQGKRHDLVDAVFALGDDDLVRIVARVEALDAFLSTEDGANLLAGYRRAVNILKAETKKNPDESYTGAVDPARLVLSQEKALAEAVAKARGVLDREVAAENFAGAMTALAALRKPVDDFFDKVLVNDPEQAVRLNRLRLLSQVRDAAGQVADFSLITG